MSNPTGVVKCVKPSIDSEEDRFNNGFYAASTDFDRTSDANNFASVSEIVPPDTDDYKLKTLIKNDSYLRNLSSDSASIIPGRSPSLIIAAGTISGSTANTSIESLPSTFLGGYLESDASYSPGDDTLKNMDICIHPILDERLSIGKEDETASLVNQSVASSNWDSGFDPNSTSNFSSRYPKLPSNLQQFTEIFENSFASNAHEQKFSGLDFHSGREVDRIFQHLRCMRESEKKIQDESFPFPSSGSSMFSEDFFKPKRVRTDVTKRKKFFSPLPNESRKESSFQKTSGEINFSPKKNKVKFSSEVCQFSGDKSQKKYVGTPRFRRNKEDEQPKDVETGKKDPFLHREQNIDTSSIRAVAQLRKLFSPGRKTQGLSEISVNIPRIEVVKATPKRTVNTPLDTVIKEFRKKNRSPSGERKSPRKPW